LNGTTKLVFSRTLKDVTWFPPPPRTRLARGRGHEEAAR